MNKFAKCVLLTGMAVTPIINGGCICSPKQQPSQPQVNGAFSSTNYTLLEPEQHDSRSGLVDGSLIEGRYVRRPANGYAKLSCNVLTGDMALEIARDWDGQKTRQELTELEKKFSPIMVESEPMFASSEFEKYVR